MAGGEAKGGSYWPLRRCRSQVREVREARREAGGGGGELVEEGM